MDRSSLDILVTKLKKKKIKLGKAVIDKVVVYLLLVYFRYRDAYLVDCCFLGPHDATVLIAEMSSMLELDFRSFVVLKLQMDCIIFNKSKMKEKVQRLKEQDWSCHPFIINVTGDTPRMVCKTHLERIAAELEESIQHWQMEDDNLDGHKTAKSNDSKVEENVLVISLEPSESFNKTVGLPFIAGWLIGYPCLYVSLDENGVNCLSFTSLEKYSLRGEFKLALGSETYSTIDLMEFTIPNSISQSDDGSRGFLEQALLQTQARIHHEAGLKLDTCTDGVVLRFIHTEKKKAGAKSSNVLQLGRMELLRTSVMESSVVL